MIAQSVLELSHCENGHNNDDNDNDDAGHPSGLNYSPRRKVFRHGQKNNITQVQFIFMREWYVVKWYKLGHSLYVSPFLMSCATPPPDLSFLDANPHGHDSNLSERAQCPPPSSNKAQLFRCRRILNGNSKVTSTLQLPLHRNDFGVVLTFTLTFTNILDLSFASGAHCSV